MERQGTGALRVPVDLHQPAAHAEAQAARMWWIDWFGHDFWPWMLMGPAMMLLFVGACLSIGYLVIRAVRPSRAIDILRERYARVDIDQAEFEERRRGLLY